MGKVEVGEKVVRGHSLNFHFREADAVDDSSS